MVTTVKARKEGNIVYYFFKEGVVKGTTYSMKNVLIGMAVIFILIWLFTGYIIYGAIVFIFLYAISNSVCMVIFGSPKESKWDKLSFGKLKSEKSAVVIQWKQLSDIQLKGDRVYFTLDGKKYKLGILGDAQKAEQFLKSRK